jgi:hypothetical protein
MSDDDHIEIRDFTTIKNKGDQLRKYISKRNGADLMAKLQKVTVIDDYPGTYSWKDLFIKLCFEQMLQYFPQH